MRTREKARVCRMFMRGKSVQQLAKYVQRLYFAEGYVRMLCRCEFEVECAIREWGRKRV